MHARLYLAIIAALLGSMLLSACGPSLPRAQAEKEIGAFVLDFIIRQEIGATADYVRNSGQPWVKAPPDANIIVWAPAAGKAQNTPVDYLDTTAPLGVWWMQGNQLTEVTGEKASAIQGYRDAYMQRPQGQDVPRPWTWGYYEFGILSLSSGNRQADVYVGISCGPLCGSGTVYKLQRNDNGAWEIRGSEMRWIS